MTIVTQYLTFFLLLSNYISVDNKLVFSKYDIIMDIDLF